MSRLQSRLAKLEAQCRPPVPDHAQDDRLRRACDRLIAMMGMDLPDPTGPAFRGGDPAARLAAAERRAQCEIDR